MKRHSCFICLVIIISFCITPVCLGEEPSSASDKDVPAATEVDSYRIGSGDILEILTWKETDFSREDILVRTDGKITFPLLDDVQAAGQTTLELKKNIQARLKDFVGNPVVTVTVRNPGSQKLNVKCMII